MAVGSKRRKTTMVRDGRPVSRRGMVQGMDDVWRRQDHQGEVPLSEMFGYSTTLRSADAGRATYSMEFKHYSKRRRTSPKPLSRQGINFKSPIVVEPIN